MTDVQQLEGHWLACMASAGGGGKVTRLGGALAVANPQVGGVAFNFIHLRSVTLERLESVLEIGSALLAEHVRPPAAWLSPLAGPVEALAEGLCSLGWRRTLRQVVLVCDLPHPGEERPPDVQVEEIDDAALETWESVLVEGYEVEPVSGREVAAAWTALLRQPGEGARTRLYLARLDGLPAGTGLTWSRGEIAGLYCGAVLPAFRRRGVERSTLVRRMHDAASASCLQAVLQTEAGSPVEHLCLNRLGFRAAYERELWQPATTLPYQTVDNLYTSC